MEGGAIDEAKDAGQPLDISFRVLIIGRLVDRFCRAPGEYAITIVVPAHRRALWQVSLSRQELLWTGEVGR